MNQISDNVELATKDFLSSEKLNINNFNNRVFAAKFSHKKKVGRDTIEFTFAIQGNFNYQPGQYVWLSLPRLKDKDKKGNRRSMSIVSSNAKGSISIVFRAGQSDFKRAVMALKTGQDAEIIGPYGSSFLLPVEENQSVVLIAGGTGIAPFINLVHTARADKTKRSIYLFYTDERGLEAPYYHELQKIKFTNFNYHFSETPLNDSVFTSADKKKTAIYFISGPQEFVDYYYKLLKSVGVKRSNMRFENFYPSSDSVALMREIFKDGENLPQVKGDNKLTIQRRDIMFSAIQSSSHHIVITDINGVVLLANSAAEKITGFKFSEMKGQTPRLWGGLMPTPFYKKLWGSKLHGFTINGEIVNRRKDGSLYLVMSHIAPIKDKSGKILGFIGTEEDITEDRQREVAARTTAKLLESTLLGIAEGLIITDKKGKIIRVNNAACMLLGLEPDDLIGNKLVTALQMLDKDGKVIPEHKRIIDRVIESKKTVITDSMANSVYYRKKDGTRFPAYISAAPVFEDNQLVGVVEIFRDVSKDKEIDVAKSEFVSLASHQLRTPLSAINWNAELLLGGDGGKLSTDQNNFVNEIYASSQRMVELVRALLNVSRIELGTLGFDPTMQNVDELIKSILTDLEPLVVKHKVKLKLDLQKLPKISVDPRFVTLVVQNLASNAIK